MKHAAELDLIAYEDPVFYDRLERARVQATDRLGMIQSIGRLVQQVITAASLSVSILLFSPWLLLLLIVGILPAFLGESHFAFLGYARNFRQTPSSPRTRLPACAGRKPRSRQGTQTFWAEGFPHRTVHASFGSALSRKCRSGPPQADCGIFFVHDRHCRLLLGLCLRYLADRDRITDVSAR